MCKEVEDKLRCENGSEEYIHLVFKLKGETRHQHKDEEQNGVWNSEPVKVWNVMCFHAMLGHREIYYDLYCEIQ